MPRNTRTPAQRAPATDPEERARINELIADLASTTPDELCAQVMAYFTVDARIASTVPPDAQHTPMEECVLQRARQVARSVDPEHASVSPASVNQYVLAEFASAKPVFGPVTMFSTRLTTCGGRDLAAALRAQLAPQSRQ